jgi:hypothetical protein
MVGMTALEVSPSLPAIVFLSTPLQSMLEQPKAFVASEACHMVAATNMP